MRFAWMMIVCGGILWAQLPWEKNRDRVGLALYRENCVVCHDIDVAQKESKKLGPSLFQISQRRQRDYIGVRIRFGGQLMPAFAKKMSAGEIDTLLDWIERPAIPATPSAAVRP